MKKNDLTNYIYLFNMMHINKFKVYAEDIRFEGLKNNWSIDDEMDFEISYFADAYSLDFEKFRKAIIPSFNFHIKYFLEHPDTMISGEVIDFKYNDKIKKSVEKIWKKRSAENKNKAQLCCPPPNLID